MAMVPSLARALDALAATQPTEEEFEGEEGGDVAQAVKKPMDIKAKIANLADEPRRESGTAFWCACGVPTASLARINLR